MTSRICIAILTGLVLAVSGGAGAAKPPPPSAAPPPLYECGDAHDLPTHVQADRRSSKADNNANGWVCATEGKRPAYTDDWPIAAVPAVCFNRTYYGTMASSLSWDGTPGLSVGRLYTYNHGCDSGSYGSVFLVRASTQAGADLLCQPSGREIAEGLHTWNFPTAPGGLFICTSSGQAF